MTEMFEVAKKISEEMSKNNLSYAELSKLTGISKSSLQRYVTGETGKMPIPSLELIAKALHVSPSYLIGWEEKEITEPETGSDLSLNDQEQAFINWLRSLPEEKRQAVLNFADRF